MLKPSRLVAALTAIFEWISPTFARPAAEAERRTATDSAGGANVAIGSQAALDTPVVCTLVPSEIRDSRALRGTPQTFAGDSGTVVENRDDAVQLIPNISWPFRGVAARCMTRKSPKTSIWSDMNPQFTAGVLADRGNKVSLTCNA
jgi:hypothetical protein